MCEFGPERFTGLHVAAVLDAFLDAAGHARHLDIHIYV
jgi:hypothetical protein